MLKYRIISGIVLGAAPILAACFMPPIGIWIVLIVVSAIAQDEFYAMLSSAKIPSFRLVGIACGTALISATFFSTWKSGGGLENVVGRAYQWENLVLLGTLIAVFVRQFPQKHNEQPLQTIGCTLFGVWYVPFLFNYFTRLAFAWGGAENMMKVGTTGRMLALYTILVVKMTDVGAYLTGRLIGRHKLFPRISPAKTWEGLFGGLAVALAASLVFCVCVDWQLGSIRMRPHDAVILGLLLAGAGVVGDMFESLLKRGAGIKDSSSTIPGMGGTLDVLDSLLFGAPVMYAYVHLFLA